MAIRRADPIKKIFFDKDEEVALEELRATLENSLCQSVRYADIHTDEGHREREFYFVFPWGAKQPSLIFRKPNKIDDQYLLTTRLGQISWRGKSLNTLTSILDIYKDICCGILQALNLALGRCRAGEITQFDLERLIDIAVEILNDHPFHPIVYIDRELDYYFVDDRREVGIRISAVLTCNAVTQVPCSLIIRREEGQSIYTIVHGEGRILVESNNPREFYLYLARWSRDSGTRERQG